MLEAAFTWEVDRHQMLQYSNRGHGVYWGLFVSPGIIKVLKVVVGANDKGLTEFPLSQEASTLKFCFYVVQGQLTRVRKPTVSSYTVVLRRHDV